MNSIFKYVAIGIVTFILVDCKNSQKATETPAAEPETVNATQPAGVKPSKPNNEVAVSNEERMVAQPETEIPQNPEPRAADSLFFQMQRTPCFGQCPIYTLTIYKSGYATLEGRRFFPHIGNFRMHVSSDDIKTIEKWAMDAGYFDFKHQYDAPVTDLPTTTTIMQLGGKKQWVYNRMNSPDELRQFERSIEEWIKPLAWIAYTPKPEKIEE